MKDATLPLPQNPTDLPLKVRADYLLAIIYQFLIVPGTTDGAKQESHHRQIFRDSLDTACVDLSKDGHRRTLVSVHCSLDASRFLGCRMAIPGTHSPNDGSCQKRVKVRSTTLVVGKCIPGGERLCSRSLPSRNASLGQWT